MIKYVTSVLLAALLPATVIAQPLAHSKIKHVIYITLDGTRWQDVLIDKRMPILWNKYSDAGKWYGVPDGNTKIEVASVPISLPSYQSQMSGYVQPCNDNDCGRINVQTMPERLLKEFNFKKKEVATFSSWTYIAQALESVAGYTYSNTGNLPVYDPDTNIADAEMARLNALQVQDHPEYGDRFDKYTFAQAIHYFEVYQPKFLWIALTEADEAAHNNDLPAYQKIFSLYDEQIDKLLTKIKAMHVADDTMVIVTTDHGRGNGKNWTSHGPHLPSSKRTWAFVYNGDLAPIGQDGKFLRYSTTSIRPTIEGALLS